MDAERLTAQIRAHVAEVTRRSEDGVPTDVSLAALGLDSIMIIGLQGMLEDDWALPDFPIAPDATIADLVTRAAALPAGSDGADPDGADVAGPDADGADAGRADADGAVRDGATSAAAAVPAASTPTDTASTTVAASPLQRAYLVGRRPDLPLGGVAAHMYLEFDADDLDVDRAEQALRRLVERHDMLRAVLRPNGTLEVLAGCPAYEIPVTDLRSLPAAEREARLDQLRADRAHQLRPSDAWPLLDVAAVRLTDRRTRLSVFIDFVIADAVSCLSLLGEWGVLYRDLDAALPELPTTFAGWSREHAAPDPAKVERARAYWAPRIARLPPAPELPLAADPRDVVGARFTRTQVRLDAPSWAALREQAAARGLTTSVVLCAAYARALADESRRPDFTLTLTLFNRPPLPNIDRVVGDFSSTTLLAVDASPRRTFAALARALQDRLWVDLQHRAVPGMAVLRELWKARGQGAAPLLPVVFTSLFEDFSGLEWLGENVYGVSETPQVYLDHQTFERDGELVLQFDHVPAVVPPDLLARLVERQTALLGGLARDSGAWDALGERQPA